jgi:hypothetical protein
MASSWLCVIIRLGDSSSIAIFLPDLCPQGKNLEEKIEKERS